MCLFFSRPEWAGRLAGCARDSVGVMDKGFGLVLFAVTLRPSCYLQCPECSPPDRITSGWCDPAVVGHRSSTGGAASPVGAPQLIQPGWQLTRLRCAVVDAWAYHIRRGRAPS